MTEFEKVFDELDCALGIDPGLRRERDAALAALGPRPPWWRVRARRRWDKAHDVIMAMNVSQMAVMMRMLYPREIAAELASRKNVALGMLTKTKR